MYAAYVRRGNVVHLGPDVTCDGFNLSPHGVRVQTHVHHDHMTEWSTSLGKIIYMTRATKELLIAEDSKSSFRFRSNICAEDFHKPFTPSGCTGAISLYSSGHMLGGCMVSVSHLNLKYLYTSDFSWPLPNPDIELLKRSHHDVLVIDATYGHPVNSRRDYSQDDVVVELLALVSRRLGDGPVRLIGSRGRLQRAYQLIETNLSAKGVDFFGSDFVDKTISVYHDHFGMAGACYKGPIPSPATTGKNSVLLVDARDQKVVETPRPGETIIRLAETRSTTSLVTSTKYGYQVSMTDHADFAGTIAMIELVNPTGGVLTNGRYASELAAFVREELGREACCAVMPSTRQVVGF